MDDGKGMATVIRMEDRTRYESHAPQHRPNKMEPRSVGSSVLDSPFLEWVTQRPETLERRTLPLSQRIAQQVTYLTITLAFVGVVAYAGYITGA